MSSRRVEIRTALVAALGAIDGVSPYESTPRAIYLCRRPIESCSRPCLILPDEEESRENASFRRAACELQFTLFAVCDVPSADERALEIDRLVADVERVVGSNPTLGLSEYGVQLEIVDVGIERGTEYGPFCMAMITITTPYRFSRGTP